MSRGSWRTFLDAAAGAIAAGAVVSAHIYLRHGAKVRIEIERLAFPRYLRIAANATREELFYRYALGKLAPESWPAWSLAAFVIAHRRDPRARSGAGLREIATIGTVAVVLHATRRSVVAPAVFHAAHNILIESLRLFERDRG